MERNCLMIQVTSDAIYQAQAALSHDDVIELETNPHVTVLYGIDPAVPSEAVRSISATYQPHDLVSYSVTYFQKPEYDVLKFDIDDRAIYKLNESVRELPYENAYPNYTPHVTIAYLKRGTAKKYVKRFTPAIFTPQGFHYSTAAGGNEYWQFGSKPKSLSELLDPVPQYYLREYGIDLSQYDFSAEPEDLTPITDDLTNHLTAAFNATRYENSFFELTQLLKGTNAVEIIFSEVTKPGTIATRLATLNPTFVNRVYNFKGATVPRPPGLRRYIDLTAKGWRSFYYGRVIQYRETAIPINTIPFPPIN